MNEIKPCPFCGNKARLTIFLGRPAIACTICPAIMYKDYVSDTVDLILAWNTRNEIEEIYSELARVYAKTTWKEMKEEQN